MDRWVANAPVGFVDTSSYHPLCVSRPFGCGSRPRPLWKQLLGRGDTFPASPRCSVPPEGLLPEREIVRFLLVFLISLHSIHPLCRLAYLKTKRQIWAVYQPLRLLSLGYTHLGHTHSDCYGNVTKILVHVCSREDRGGTVVILKSSTLHLHIVSGTKNIVARQLSNESVYISPPLLFLFVK